MIRLDAGGNGRSCFAIALCLSVCGGAFAEDEEGLLSFAVRPSHSLIQSAQFDTGKWPASEAVPAKQLAEIIASVNLSDPEVTMRLAEAADSNGFAEMSEIFFQMAQASNNGDVQAMDKLASKVNEFIDQYVADAQTLAEGRASGEGGVAAPPVNDACGSAILVTSSPSSSTAGTLVESTNDAAPACSVCQTTGGVWYKVAGTGNRIIASLCNASTTFDTKLSVYSTAAGAGCGTLTCVDGNDDVGTTGSFPFACAGGGTKSIVAWCSTVGTDYYVLVHSFGTLSTFQLDVSEDATACTIPANDACAAATVFTQAQAAATFTDSGVVYRQAHDDFDVSCNSGTCPVARRGIWYSWTPTSATSLIVSTNTTGSSTYKAIFSGGCGGLTQLLCSNSDAVGISGFTPGTQYWILIGHRSDFSEPTAAVNVTFALPPANDLCPNAITVVPGTVAVPSQTSGTTINSFADSAGTCSSVANTQPGVWYRVIGTGNTITADTCAAGSSPPVPTLADTRITIYTCGCACKTCVTANDLASPSCTGFTARARATWCTELGREYLILVHQGSATTGNFRLDMSDNGTACSPSVVTCPVVSDECSPGLAVFDGPNAFSNTCSTVGTDAKCTPTMGSDVWYNYTATCSGAAVIDTCGGVPNAGPDTVLQVYNGCNCPASFAATIGCNDDTLGCGSSGFASKVTVPVLAGNCYKVRLGNWSSSGTTFTLVSGTLSISCLPAVCGNNTIEPGEACDGTAVGTCLNGCTPPGPGGCQCLPPPNNDCGNASTAINGANAFNRALATTDGSPEPAPPCDFPFGDDQLYHDVWFNYTASCTGRLLVDTCEGVGLDTRVAVYPGCGCPVSGPLSCNDDSGSADELSDPDMDPDTCNQGGSSPYESATRNQVVQGNCYKIRVGSFSDTSTHDGADSLFIQCITKGACCDANNGCVDGVISTECTGAFFAGQSCDMQSCCLNNSCVMLAAVCCTNAGGTPGGSGSSCGTCGDGIVGCGEQCDPPGACCSNMCQLVAGGTTCRGAAGLCDVAEQCTGTSGTCPPDMFATSGTPCRASTGPCDPAESCDGSSAACPADAQITQCLSGDGCCPAGCNNGNDSDCPLIVPTLSEWGLAFLTLAGIALGSVVFARRFRALKA